MERLVAERPPDDPVGLFELASAFDSTGHPEPAAERYRPRSTAASRATGAAARSSSSRAPCATSARSTRASRCSRPSATPGSTSSRTSSPPSRAGAHERRARARGRRRRARPRSRRTSRATRARSRRTRRTSPDEGPAAAGRTSARVGSGARVRRIRCGGGLAVLLEPRRERRRSGVDERRARGRHVADVPPHLVERDLEVRGERGEQDDVQDQGDPAVRRLRARDARRRR